MTFDVGFDVIDLCAGVGGWGLAVRDVGYSHIGIELDPAACRTRLAAGHSTIESDVRHIDPRLVDFSEMGLCASPPCQTFSRAGKLSGYAHMDHLIGALQLVADGARPDKAVAHVGDDALDERSVLVLEPMRWAVALEPGWLCLEQVPLVLPMWEAYADVLRSMGYSVWAGITDAADYGVPQHRKRALLVATKLGLAQRPPVTHPVAVTLGEVLASEPDMRLRPGSWADAPTSGRRYYGMGEASPTVAFGKDTSGWHLVRGDWSRELSMSELGVLQGFPADYPWLGSKVAQVTQVGNAIPPAMARAAVMVASGRTMFAAA